MTEQLDDSVPRPSAAHHGPAWRPGEARVAYFTMEVGLDDALPTYSGGLGVLAGDYLRSAADLHMPLVAVTLLYRDGYFRQIVDAHGRQSEEPVQWRPEDVLERLDVTVEVEISGRSVRAVAWHREVVGVTGGTVAVYFLDTDLEANAEEDRSLTDKLYGGDERHRLSQEALLGIGGVDLLEALGCSELTTFHMNEGHSSLLTLRLMERLGSGPGVGSGAGAGTGVAAAAAGLDVAAAAGVDAAAAQKSVRDRCVFTTHTPVPAGHDRFPAALVREVLGERRAGLLEELGLLEGGELNMTELGVAASRYVNAVSRRHQRVAREMLAGVDVASITNGVHSSRWASPEIARLLDEYAEGWRRDSSLLRYAIELPLETLAAAHDAAKRRLLSAVKARSGVRLERGALTIGLARRITPYKQTTLLFSDLDRVRAIAEAAPLQVVCAGKAHPRDEPGKALIEQLVRAAESLAGAVTVAFVENYDLEVAALLCAGCDLWLNNPAKPNEASGTSGMKAAVNGVPSLSVLDGWWIEGWVEGVTGWAIGGLDDDEATAGELYDKLEHAVLPTYYEDRDAYLAIGRNAVALNGSFFSTDRMAREYALLAYGLETPEG